MRPTHEIVSICISTMSLNIPIFWLQYHWIHNILIPRSFLEPPRLLWWSWSRGKTNSIQWDCRLSKCHHRWKLGELFVFNLILHYLLSHFFRWQCHIWLGLSMIIWKQTSFFQGSTRWIWCFCKWGCFWRSFCSALWDWYKYLPKQIFSQFIQMLYEIGIYKRNLTLD